MSDLTEFLLARIAEDEARARVRLPGTLARNDWQFYHGEAEGFTFMWTSARRVLAECEAKRRIIRAFVPGFETETDRPYEDRVFARAGGGKYHSPLLALALPYADHPDYDQEWAVPGD